MDPRLNKNEQEVLAQRMTFSEKMGVLLPLYKGLMAFIIMQT